LKAFNKAMEGEAKRKYFEHSGALLTADGTDDDAIKFEGVPPGYRVNLQGEKFLRNFGRGFQNP